MSTTRLQTALDVLDRADDLFALGGRAGLSPTLREDLSRHCLVMGVSALDTWMHWTIARADLKTLSHAIRHLEVPFGALVDIAETSVESRRNGPGIVR